MPNAADLLMQSHRTIRRLLAGLDDRYDDDTMRRLVHEVDVHLEAEERLLYPVVEDNIHGVPESVDVFTREHAELRDAVEQLAKASDPDGRVALLHAARTVFERHVHREEADVLPRCQSELGEARMQELGRELDAFYESH
ncbi:MAG TPA: hemerythrin domain-containing protein [Acidimicrobiia bacterium]|nr:hemerythrin domain-containing protein [Acidimicrobiia bacterium]